MQEQKLQSQSAKAKKKKCYQAGKKPQRMYFMKAAAKNAQWEKQQIPKSFVLKKEAYTPEYSPGYAAQEKRLENPN